MVVVAGQPFDAAAVPDALRADHPVVHPELVLLRAHALGVRRHALVHDADEICSDAVSAVAAQVPPGGLHKVLGDVLQDDRLV